MSKKIAVLGTGANGSCISADLVGAGLDVTMIDQWPDHVEAMRRDGLVISLHDEKLHVEVDAQHICDLCSLNRVFDIVLICFKAYDTRWAAELIKPYLAENAIVVGVQNCMTADDIAEIVGPSRTIGCVVELASQMFDPGKVKRSTTRAKSWFRLGALEPSMQARVAEIEGVLKNAGNVSLNENIQSLKWMKFITSAMYMGPEAIIGMTDREAAHNLPGMRDLMLKCGNEALRAGQSQGYTIEPVFGLSREELEASNSLPEMLFDKVAATLGSAAINTTSQDLMKGRYSEVDLTNGRVVEENAKHGDASPANRAIVEIIRRIQAGELQIDPSNLDLARKMLRS